MRTGSSSSQNVREFRRLRAIELFEAGWKASDIAKALGVTRGAVSQWLKKYRENGIEALYYKPVTKKPCRLSGEQCEQMIAILNEGAEKCGYTGDVWTSSRVRDLIETRFGVKYCVRQVSRLLKKLGWSWQKPETRAAQQDKKLVDQWWQERWPAIKKSR